MSKILASFRRFPGSTTRTRIVLLLFATLTGGMLFAQSDQAKQSAAQKPREALGGGIESTERITREIRHELLMLPYYTLFDELAYVVQGDKVILLGTVTKPVLKSDAESAIKKIEGVEAVENKIEVLPPSPADDRIRRAEYRAIYGFDGLTRYSWGTLPAIHIIVNRGRVRLVGTVDSEADKNLAGLRANGVPGVFSVQNDLEVAGSASSK
jgi:hyperosmotically inducible protein